MASGPITSWEIDGETVSDFIFLGLKITADGDYSHEIISNYQPIILLPFAVKFLKSYPWDLPGGPGSKILCS